MAPAEPGTAPTSRRGVVLRGVAAVLGAAGAAGAAVLLPAGSAAAAAGKPLLLGRSNSSGTSRTSVSTRSTSTAFRVDQTGSGAGAGVYAAGSSGLVAATAARNRWGLHGRNTATSTGTGGGVRAEGRRGTGLFADTSGAVLDVPAVVAVGGDGTGVAQVATGESYLDGDALALRSWVGVRDVDGSTLAYAQLLSGEGPTHTMHGTVDLDGSGTAEVTLPAEFRAACDMSTLTVTLTPVGAPMPNLYVSYAQADGAAQGVSDGFGVAGGAASGKAAWVAWASRVSMSLPAQSAARTARSSPSGAPGTASVPEPERRRARRSLVLPEG